MKNFYKNFVFLLFLMFLFTGCSASVLISPAVTGVLYWANGEAHQYYEQDKHTIYKTTKKVLAELNIPITKDKEESNGYSIVAGEKNKFKIHVKTADNSQITKLSIRINTLGDKEYAEFIYKKVNENLNIIIFDKQGNPTKNER